MCGFAGILNQHEHKTNRISKATLQAMSKAIEHRGPDDQGLYITDKLGLAHQRLSIIDIDSGHQPMVSIDGSIVLVFNGEIFNFIELREDLVKLGHTFVTHSDTEVIIHMYQRYGDSFVDQLNGQFSIGLWDGAAEKLLLIRDRVGICPLYYTFDHGCLIFASEIKALKPALVNGLTLSGAGLDQIFTFWSTVSPNTIFDNVYEVSPGHMMIIQASGSRQKQYWDWSYDADFSNSSEEQLIGELYELLIDATTIRLRSDVPVGAYLSGGLDSSSIVALIHKHGNIPLRTFSLNFEHESYDEKIYQDMLTKRYSTRHSQLLITSEDITNSLVDTLNHTESPILRSAPVPMGLLSNLAQQEGYKVILTGEGADEVLGGYDIFKEAKVRQFWAKNIKSKWRPLLLNRLYPYLDIPAGGESVYLKKFFGHALESPNSLFFSHLPRWSTTAKAKQFYSDEFSSTLKKTSMDTLSAYLPKNISSYHPFNRSQYIETKTLMSGYLLSSQGDRMLAKSSVEGRFPFLDHRLIEFANRLPPKVKMRGMNEKYLLKKAMAPHLPTKIINRSKQPYRAPDVNTSNSLLMADCLQEYLSEKEIKSLGFFSPKKVSFLIKKSNSKKYLSTSESQALMGILSTQIIHKNFCSN